MSTPIDPNAPAFPTPGVPWTDDHGQTCNPRSSYGWAADPIPGMPIRLELAARFLQGYCADPQLNAYTHEPLAEKAIAQADALIEAYNKNLKP